MAVEAVAGPVSSEGLDWRVSGAPAGALTPMRIVGRFRKARRCIDPPRLELTQVSGAAEYEVVIISTVDPERRWAVRSAGPEVDLAALWAELPFAELQIAIRAWGADGGLVGVGPVSNLRRSPDWSDGASEALDYVAAARGVIDYLVHRVPNAPAHPDLPGYMWHAAAASAGDGFATDLQFPALSYPSLIGLFLAGHAAGIGDELGVDLLARCRQLADHLIDHPAVADGPLAGVPLTTMGQDGTGGLFEPDRITLLRLGWTGRTMLALAAATGEPRYGEYARRLGQILLDFQQENGSWPYRVRLSDGAVLEPYSAAAVMALLLFEQLEGAAYAAALERGLSWTLANPVQTGLWQQMYEDVPSLEPYDNLEQWAALETAMLLLRRGHPDGLRLARELVRYVEDQFVVFGDDPVFSTSYLPFAPAVLEQYHCYWPMDFHTANYVRAALALHEAGGEAVWARKAVAAANTIVRCQGPDGRFSTLVPDRRLGVAPAFSDWFNCMANAAEVLLRHAPALTGLARSEVGAAD